MRLDRVAIFFRLCSPTNPLLQILPFSDGTVLVECEGLVVASSHLMGFVFPYEATVPVAFPCFDEDRLPEAGLWPSATMSASAWVMTCFLTRSESKSSPATNVQLSSTSSS